MVKSEVVDKMAALITAAFGLVAALAWNSAIQNIFMQVFGQQSSITAQLTYAIIVTIIAVLATLWVGYLAQAAKPRAPAPDLSERNSQNRDRRRR